MTAINFVSLASVYVSCEVVLNSTLPKGQLACPGDEITFTCMIRGSPTLTNLIIAWSSIHYIGENDLLQFTTSNMMGNTYSSMINVDVVATLTNNAIVSGVSVLESQLRIIVSENFSTPTVTCHSWTNQDAASMEFYIPGRLFRAISYKVVES